MKVYWGSGGGVIPSLPQYVFMTLCLVTQRDKFTSTFTFHRTIKSVSMHGEPGSSVGIETNRLDGRTGFSSRQGQ
jgi:hypothetical protein